MPSKNEPRISLGHWLLVGGRGPPPSRSKFLRMTSERKASHREATSREAAKEAAYSRAKEAHDKAGEEHGTPGFMGFVKTQLGLEKQKGKLKRKELMERFGGKEKSLRKSRGTVPSNADGQGSNTDLQTGRSTDSADGATCRETVENKTENGDGDVDGDNNNTNGRRASKDIILVNRNEVDVRAGRPGDVDEDDVHQDAISST